MDNQRIIRIECMDYLSLVYMLLEKITPDTRKKILERLNEMNEQLIRDTKNKQRKQLYAKEKSGSRQLQEHQIIDEIDMDDILNDIYHNSEYKNTSQNFPKRDIMDIKLDRIQKLYDKIITDKKNRKIST